MLPLGPLRHHGSPLRSPPQRVSFSTSSPASLDPGRNGGGSLGSSPGRRASSPARAPAGASTYPHVPPRALTPLPKCSRRASELPSVRWQRSDAAREATAEAHLAAETACVVSGQARDASARASEARQSVTDLMSAFHPHQLHLPFVLHYS